MVLFTNLFFSAAAAYQIVVSPDATRYSHDGRTCCLDGELSADFVNGHCQYDSSWKEPSLDFGNYVTKCCWNKPGGYFHVHYANIMDKPQKETLDISGSGTYPNSFCNLEVRWHITEYTLTQDELQGKISLHFDNCWPINVSDTKWIPVKFNSAYTDAGSFEFSGFLWGVEATVKTRVNTRRLSVEISGHATGSGVAGRLDEHFDVEISHDILREILSKQKIC